MSNVNQEIIDEIKSLCKKDDQLYNAIIELLNMEDDSVMQWRNNYLDIVKKYIPNTEN